jgi:hypothetical protein
MLIATIFGLIFACFHFMKTKLLLLLIGSLFLLSFTSPRKEKRTILKKVNNYIEQTVSDTSYTIDKSQLLLLLDYYFISKGYECTSYNEYSITYTKPVTYYTGGDRTYFESPGVRETDSYRTIDGVTVTRTRDVPIRKTKRSIYTNLEYVNVRIDYTQQINTFSIVSSKERTNKAKHPFKEHSLRKFLYSQCFGSNLALPRELSQEIEAYNATQIKEKKKIVFN